MAVSIPEQFKVSLPTTVTDDYGTVIDYTDDGASHIRDLYPNAYYQIDAVWDLLDKTDAETLRSFLLFNRSGIILIDVDGITYRCKMIGYPKNNWVGGTLRKVVASFRGTIDG